MPAGAVPERENRRLGARSRPTNKTPAQAYGPNLRARSVHSRVDERNAAPMGGPNNG